MTHESPPSSTVPFIDMGPRPYTEVSVPAKHQQAPHEIGLSSVEGIALTAGLVAVAAIFGIAKRIGLPRH